MAAGQAWPPSALALWWCCRGPVPHLKHYSPAYKPVICGPWAAEIKQSAQDAETRAQV